MKNANFSARGMPGHMVEQRFPVFDYSAVPYMFVSKRGRHGPHGSSLFCREVLNIGMAEHGFPTLRTRVDKCESDHPIT